MSIKKRITSVVALALAAMMTLTACGGTTNTPADSSTTPTSTPTSTETPSAGGTETPSTPAAAPTSFSQSPWFDGKDYPPVEERLPNKPKVVDEVKAEDMTTEIGTYGGTLRTVTSIIDYDADVYVANQEGLLSAPSIDGDVFTPNLVENYEVSEDQKEFTFTLREGLKWSDGEPVTMDDFKFTYEKFWLNEELVPVIPAWLRSGGTAEGTPFVMEFVDDKTFKIKFDQPYGGFLVHLAIAGWKSYPELLKPEHYLSKYHKDCEEYDEAAVKEVAKANSIAEDDIMWVNVFNKMDIHNSEMNRKESIGFPKLYPWILTDAGESVYTYERNPYYHKVDAKGQQLPYIDEIRSELVQDMEMVTMKTIGGEVDFSRESAALINMPMYKENEKNGYTTLFCNMHTTPTDIGINMTYDDKTYQEVTQDVRFRQALNYALNREEIIDTIYYGYAEPSTALDSTYDVDKANALLDEMGMDKRDDKGMRLAPNGQPFNFLIEVGAEAPDIVPVAELAVEMWREIGIDVTMKRIEASLIGNKRAANELQGNIIWTHTSNLWYAQDWAYFMWGRAWEVWKTKATKVNLTNEDGTTKEVELESQEPPQEVKDLYALVDSLTVVSPDKVDGILAEIDKNMQENVWYFQYLKNVKQPVIVSSKLANVSENLRGIGLDLSLEQAFFKA